MEDSVLNQTCSALDELRDLVQSLRGENGCPWDRKQTPTSIGLYIIEEVFELVDAIESGNPEHIEEELGDVLFHIVFIARMFEERGEFDLSQVARSITKKMIRRHPHVFDKQKIGSSEEVVQNWHKIKLNEKKDLNKKSLLDSVPSGLPALMRAYRVSDRVAKSGFEWTGLAKNKEDMEAAPNGLQTLLKNSDSRLASRQFGDMLFALINIARIAEIHPENALAGSVKEFEARFKEMEELITESKRELDEVPLEEKIRIWEKVQTKAHNHE